MPNPKQTLLLVLILLFANSLAGQQTQSTIIDRISFGFGINRAYSNTILDATKHSTNYGNIILKNRWSLLWPMDEEKTKISPSSSFFRKFDFSLSAEKDLSRNFSLGAGIESGSRSFKITETYYSNPLLPITSFRNYHVLSVPVMLKYYGLLDKNFLISAGVGVSGHYTSSETVFGYYTILRKHNIFPTLNFEGEISIPNKGYPLISLFARYELGFYDVLKEHVTPLTNIMEPRAVPQPITLRYLKDYAVHSKGSCLKFGIRFYINFGKAPKTIKPKPPKPVVEKPEPKYMPEELAKIELQERPIGKRQETVVDTDVVQICVIDDQTLDGDSVTIEVDGKFIVENHLLTKVPRCFNVKLTEDYPSYVIFHAINEGRIKPNTMKVILRAGAVEREFLVKNDLSKSGIIKIIYKPSKK